MTQKTIDEIENDGSKAYWDDRDRDDNPYDDGTPESEAWYRGWDQSNEENDDPERPCPECDQPIEECACEHDEDDDCPECELPADDCTCRYTDG